jgi:hypothetical protein
MRKALLPMIASLALCGTATIALIATNARAEQTVRRPMMIAQISPTDAAAPHAEGGPPPDMQDAMMDRGERRGQFCKDMYAHKVGELAFVEAKLSLSANQAPLFEHWKQASLDIAKAHEVDCSAREPRQRGQHRSVMDRLTMEETMLKRRLADIQTERPTLAALYDSLTPAQKEEFGHGGMRGRMMGMMGRHPGMGPDRMGPGSMGHGPMGDAPPPPPAQ